MNFYHRVWADNARELSDLSFLRSATNITRKFAIFPVRSLKDKSFPKLWLKYYWDVELVWDSPVIEWSVSRLYSEEDYLMLCLQK